MKTQFAVLIAMALGVGATAHAATPEPAVPIEVTQTAQLYFMEPMDGATVDRPFAIKFGVRTVTVTPGMSPPVTAAPDNQIHLLIDAPPVSANMPVLRSDQVRLLTSDQKEKFVLPSGPHRLQLVQTDKNGVLAPLPVVSPVINITVK
ncbi:DUF4399 domain-containing protein [Pseudomonas turukhanskensis]|uniref:DUF4399 domain-containing protein n=1 Tax=Pseudomonas turukhanskensis TaxID=1806536 RepID=A0A9W6K448_9PSED|nr:DUF4399 domain-containing protein [Pseudomonas turukhanskensis]GLK87395.1 hypothetical protein GCM10017655_04570 [Pseudomonas turukhanskensis]